MADAEFVTCPEVALTLSVEEAQDLLRILDFVNWNEKTRLARNAEDIFTALAELLEDNGYDVHKSGSSELSACVTLKEEDE